MSPASPALVAAVEIKVDGEPLDPSITERLLEARVQDNLMVPDAFVLRLRDPDFQLVDGTLLDVGARVELTFAATGASSPADAFTGEVATIAPQFEGDGCVLVVRGYDISHKLNRTRNTRTFQDMTASDIASKLIAEAGLPAAVEPTRDVYPFEQQSNETDWDFLWRLAVRVSHELACAGDTIHFRRPGAAAGSPVQLRWGEELTAFHPRATAVAQVDNVTVSGWDPKARRRVTADAQTAQLDSRIGLQRDDLARGLGGGTFVVSDEIVSSQDEADALAQSTLDRLASAWLEADGVSRGNPGIRAGRKVTVAGIGTRFGGEYLVTRSTHVIRGQRGYETEFEVSGRSRRTLIDLLTPSPRRAYADALVIGIVTNADDPDGAGRVRVKFPDLDERHEGWWARVVSAGAGDTGLTTPPLVDDEVVVGFEHGDPRRPFVLGCLSSAPGRPGASAAGGGKPGAELNLRGDGDVAVDAGGDLSLDSAAAIEARSASDLALRAGGSLAIEGDGDEISITGAGGSVVIARDGSIAIRGTQITVDASAKLALTSSGVVELRGSQIVLG
ncbi:MAG: VgrG-related protein [Solirubrobacteraceae bacterium]|nr:VgrG-related protein [Solirubrobacteraceae bacterium]